MNKPQGASRPYPIYIYAILVLLTLAVYWQVAGFDFINTDDQTYVVRNSHVHGGLTMASIRWAFTSSHAANWHPVTWISHMLDWRLFGANPAGHHLVNVLLHLASVLLLFYLLARTTSRPWRSAFVAAVFAVHPLHVESVAWVAERKDVLSTLFWMLTMLAYVRYVEKPRLRRYVLVVIAFALGLMAKPMLVSLPIVLLLLDYWPLARARVGWGKLVVEKAPLLVLSAGSSAVTFWAQHAGRAVASLGVVPPGVRAANAAVAAVGYIGKTICPLNLAMFYPHPMNSLPAWQVIGSTAFLALATVGAIVLRHKRGYLLVGWLWYIVTLIPVIGLVQVGRQAMADRYMYIPLVGLLIIVSWAVPDASFLRSWLNEAPGDAARRRLAGAVVAVVIFGLAISAYFQAGYWRNSITLNEHAISVMSRNYFAMNNLGTALLDSGRVDEAVAQYAMAVQIAPDFGDARFNLARALSKAGKLNASLAQYVQAMRLLPDCADIYDDMGVILIKQDRLDDAMRCFDKVLRLDLNRPATYNNVGIIQARRGRLDEAAKSFRKALDVDPNFRDAQNNLNQAIALSQQQGLPVPRR